MNGSVLIFGSNKDVRKDKAIEMVNNIIKSKFEYSELSKKPDILILKPDEGKKSIGIRQSREAITFLSQKPFELKSKFLLIFDAEKLTTQAQNALLKTLEEPPGYANIILTSKLQNSLLETVVSRCRQIQVKGEKDEKSGIESLKKILKMSLGERLDYAQELAKEEKEDVIDTLENWINDERKEMLKAPGKEKHTKNIKKMIEIMDDLENTNVNPRLSLETLLLRLSEN
jgi:DNA polymerase III gamma/tau subunit